MPRGPRLDAPGVVHHVLSRGIARRRIFLSDEDRADFIERLQYATRGDRAFVYAWALIPNHFHLAIRTGTESLSSVMRRLMTGFAVAFNHRHKRHGHLFQNRYKSTIVDDEAYLLSLLRYIHRNPLRAGLVKSMTALAAYPWTGHSSLMGLVERDFQDHDERILGDGEFVESILAKAENQKTPTELSDAEKTAGLTALQNEICKRLKLSPQSLRSGGRSRPVVHARMIAAHVAGRYLGWAGKDLAQVFRVTASVISRGMSRGEKAIEELGWEIEELI